MSNDIQALHGHLFDTLQQLKDKNNPMDIDRAKAITDVAQTIINAAKVEVDFMRVNGSGETRFFHKPALPGASSVPADEVETDPDQGYETASGVVSIDHRNGQRILTHRLK